MSRVLGAVAVAALVATAAAVGLAPAADATTYRYWVYWHYAGGSWQYSGVGPAGYRVPDGGVEGWRFGRGQSSSSVATPRLAGSYDELCPAQPASADGTQVAVVIDYGTESDAPSYPYRPAHCITLSASHQGSDALVRAVKQDGPYSIRVENGLVCAIRDYPKAPECGKTVDDPKPSTAPAPKPTSAAPPTPAPPPRLSSAAPTRVAAPSATERPRAAGTTQPTATPPPATSAGASAAPASASAAEPPPAEPAAPRRSPLGLVAGGVLVLALAAAAATRARR